MSAGPLVISAGLLLLVRIDARANILAQALPAVLVFGLGLAINVAPLTSTTMNAGQHELTQLVRSQPLGVSTSPVGQSPPAIDDRSVVRQHRADSG
jgi:hypothetical protein